MRKHRLIKLSEAHAHHPRVKPIPPEYTERLKNLYVILTGKGEDSALARVFLRIPYAGNGEVIMFHKGQGRIGPPSFKMDTQMTLESSDTEIEDELERYAAARYKAVSMFIFPELREISERRLNV